MLLFELVKEETKWVMSPYLILFYNFALNKPPSIRVAQRAVLTRSGTRCTDTSDLKAAVEATGYHKARGLSASNNKQIFSAMYFRF